MKTKKNGLFSKILLALLLPGGLFVYYYTVEALNIIHLATFMGDWIVK
jgi:hypothetical protein